MKHQKSAVNLGTKIKMIRFKPGLGGKKAIAASKPPF
jgi:hypothetical protein